MHGLHKAAFPAVALMFLGGQALANPGNYTVDCSKGKTVGDALAFGAADITVIGTCSEYVMVARHNVTIRGEQGAGAEIVAPTANRGDVVTVAGGGDVTIANLTIRGGRVGVLVRNGGRATITDSVVDGNSRTGVRASEAGSVSVYSSTISNNGRYGIEIEQGSTASIGGDSAEPPYYENYLAENRSGIRVYRNGFAFIGHNSISRTDPNNFVGISVGAGSAAKLDTEGLGQGLSVSGYATGLRVEEGANVYGAIAGDGISGTYNSVSMHLGATMWVAYGNYPDGFTVSRGSTVYLSGQPDDISTSGIFCSDGGRAYENATAFADASCAGL